MRFLIIATCLMLALSVPTSATALETEPQAQACKETQRQVASGIVVSTETDCSAQADIKVQDCVWGGYWDTTEAGPLTVRVYKCSPPQATQASLGPCPSEKQLGIGTLYLAEGCAAQLDIKFYDCIWGGHWDTYGAEPATIRLYSCDATPPTRTSLDARPCPAYSGSSYAVSFETRADCTGWVYVGDGARLCPALGMRPAGSTVQSVGPLTVGAMNCALY